jgi:hypothetical protein
VKMLADAKGLAPAAGNSRAEYLPFLRASRNKVNGESGGWLFSPDMRAADRVESKYVEAPSGTLVLLSTDGFLALASDYGAYDAMGLIVAARDRGLKTLSNCARLRPETRKDACFRDLRKAMTRRRFCCGLRDLKPPRATSARNRSRSSEARRRAQ